MTAGYDERHRCYKRKGLGGREICESIETIEGYLLNTIQFGNKIDGRQTDLQRSSGMG